MSEETAKRAGNQALIIMNPSLSVDLISVKFVCVEKEYASDIVYVVQGLIKLLVSIRNGYCCFCCSAKDRRNIWIKCA